MKQVWIIIAAALALVALVLVLNGAYDKAFIAAAAGAVGWFLSYRVQMKEKNDREEIKNDVRNDVDTNEE